MTGRWIAGIGWLGNPLVVRVWTLAALVVMALGSAVVAIQDAAHQTRMDAFNVRMHAESRADRAAIREQIRLRKMENEMLIRERREILARQSRLVERVDALERRLADLEAVRPSP